MSTGSILLAEQIAVVMFLVAAAVAVGTRRLRLPYTVGLVVIGLLITLVTPRPVQFDPQLILLLLLPPLVFEAAFHIHLNELRQDLGLILLLAIPGVALTTLLVGWLVSWGTGIALQAALVFGALVSATDPVAVVALFRRLGAPRRLQVILEAESLLNDGTAIVMFGLMLGAASAGSPDLARSAADFLTVSGGGLLTGAILGLVMSLVISRIDDPLVETMLTTALAFGSYLLAETLHVSGVLAVVTAGLISGSASQRVMSASTRLVLNNFWEYAAFVANSFIFLLIGLATDLDVLFRNWPAILWAILAVLAARAVSAYGFSLLGRRIPDRWKHVLFWGGLRGAIALVLALSLPSQGIFAAERGRLQAMAFGVVLFTLLVQGVSMDGFVRRLGLVVRLPARDEYELRHARFVAARAGYDHLQRLSREGLISEHTWQKMSAWMRSRNEKLGEEARQAMSAEPEVEAAELDASWREALRAQRSALGGLLHDGVISEEVFSTLAAEVDALLMNEDPAAPWDE